MGKLLGVIGVGIVYFCFASFVVVAGGVGYLWGTGRINQDKMFRILAIVQDVDLATMEAEHKSKLERQDNENVALEEILRARTDKSLDFDLREQALRNGLGDLRNLQTELVKQRERYNLLKEDFDTDLKQLENVAKDNAILEVQRTLEAIQPKQAKDHILRMLPEGFVAQPEGTFSPDDENAIIAVVTILKAMPLDKRKKIIAEFKTDEEAKTLAELFRRIRLGVPEVGHITNTRDRLQEFNADNP